MGIKVTKDGFSFEVDTADELEIVMRVLRHVHIAQKASNETEAVEPKSLTEFFKGMEQDSKQSQIIAALRGKPQGIPDYELRALLGLESGPALGGTLGALTKMANKAGLNSSDIIETRIEPDKSGFSMYVYRLTDKMQEAIKDVT